MLAVYGYGRPDTWNWLLMFHVLSALVLVAGAFLVTTASLYALRAGTPERVLLLRRLALRTNLFLAIPAFVGAYVLGIALADKEFPDDAEEPDWLGIGFGLTDLYGIVGIILLSLLQWWVVRRARRGDLRGWQAQLASWLAPVGLALLLVVLFAMSAKPGS